jgi:hypothetical protein
VSVGQVSRHAEPDTGQWRVAWQVQNVGHDPIQVMTTRLPHGRFRSKERALTPAPTLLPGDHTRIEASVACHEAPGIVVENAFLILRVLRGEEPWQVFARFRVDIDEQGAPATTTEIITTQPVGFSTAWMKGARRWA